MNNILRAIVFFSVRTVLKKSPISDCVLPALENYTTKNREREEDSGSHDEHNEESESSDSMYEVDSDDGEENTSLAQSRLPAFDKTFLDRTVGCIISPAKCQVGNKIYH